MSEPDRNEAEQRIAVGFGDAWLLVPAGWAPVEVGARLLEETLADRTTPAPDVFEATVPDVAAVGAVPSRPFAIGVARRTEARLAANVLLYRSGDGLDVEAEHLGAGQVWHDSVGVDGTSLRVVMRSTDVLGVPVTIVHHWFVLVGEPVLAVATVPSNELAREWPAVQAILRSLVDVRDAAWEAVF